MNTVQRAEQTSFVDHRTFIEDRTDVAKRSAARSVTINDRKTTIRLEPGMWNVLCRIAEDHRLTVNQLCSRIDDSRGDLSMTAAARSYIVIYLQKIPFAASRGRGEMQSIDIILESLGTAYVKGELLRIRIERGNDVLVKVAMHLNVLERGNSNAIADIYREWVRRRDQPQYLPRITELSDRLLGRATKETMLSVIDLIVDGHVAQPHQDPVMAWNMGNASHSPRSLLCAAFQQDMLAVEQQAEPIYQVNQIRLNGSEQVYKRLLLPLSDDGSDVTRVLVAALRVGGEAQAAPGAFAGHGACS